jgi:hypothetical protein
MAHSFYPEDLRRDAIALLRAGFTNAAVGVLHRVPAGTIGYWKYVDRLRHPDLYPPLGYDSCPACQGLAMDASAYAYLLGLYLGDGHIIHKYR